MGNKAASPLPTYRLAIQQLQSDELAEIQRVFNTLSCNSNVITLPNFLEYTRLDCSIYVRKSLLTRVFMSLDSKKDNVIDIEEFVCGVALFRDGDVQELVKILYFMYESKTGGMTRESLRQLLVDSMLINKKDDISPILMESWIQEQHDLSDGMAELALYQYASNLKSIDLNEFKSFFGIEGNLQNLLRILASYFRGLQ